jgi:ligand-binding SRPBCC domain-containing protein
MSCHFHTLRQEQWIERSIVEVFPFFANPRNLEIITPPWLNFRILSASDATTQTGSEILYRIAWHGLPMHWKTGIRQWQPPHRFVDTQIAGPYRLWHHTHKFEAHGERTRMLDVVRYRLPFGPLGRLVHRAKVRRDVERIFAYRRAIIAKLFPVRDPLRLV